MKRSIAYIGLGLAVVAGLYGSFAGTSAMSLAAAPAPVEGAMALPVAMLRATPVQSQGEQILQRACTTCHDLGGVDEFRAAYDAAALRDLVTTMISYGALLSEAEVDTLVAYLAGGDVDIGSAAAQPAGGPDPTAIDEAVAVELINARCTLCHDLTGIERGLYSADEWRETVSRMLGYGATLSEEEFELIVTYLGSSPADAGETAAEAAPALDEARAAELIDSRCTLCHDLSNVERGLYTADEWRETVSRMLGYGLTLSEEEFELIVNYLGTAPGEAGDAGPAYDVEAATNLLNTACTTCHDLSAITDNPGVYTEAEFRDTIYRMFSYGLSIGDAEVDLLVTHLTATYGADQ